MILDSFELHSFVFQMEYENAFELWDRSGGITRKLHRIWPGLDLIDAQPQQQALRAKGAQIQTGLDKATVTLRGANSMDAQRIQQLSETFEVWRTALELTEVKRISTRATYLKDFDSLKEANSELINLGLARWPQSKVFDQPVESDRNGIEVNYRFEDKDAFALLRFRAEELTYKVDLDSRFVKDPEIKKTKRHMIIDFDRGLLGAVSAQKFRMEDWIKGFAHLLRRDLEKVIKAQK